LSAETGYTYRLRAVLGNITSDYTDPETVTTPPPPPPPPPVPPSNLTVTAASSSSITLTWTVSPTEAASYELERKLGDADSIATYTQVATPAAGVTTYTDTDTSLTSATTYTYRLRAVKGGLYSEYTDDATATTKLTTPDDFIAEATTWNTVSLTWTPVPESGATYALERRLATSESEDDFEQLGDSPLPADTAGYTDTGLSAETSYIYRLRAVLEGNASDYAYTDPETVTTPPRPPLPPAPPSNLTATAANSSIIILTWTASPTEAASYELERKLGDIDSTATYTQVATPAAGVTTYTDTDTGLTSATTYTYRLRAVKGGLYSDYTAAATATTKLTTPGDFAVEATAWNTVSLTWTPVPEPGATYALERRSATSEDEDAFEQLGDGPLPADIAEYTDTGLAASTTYIYRLRAVLGDNISDYVYTVPETVTTPPQPPSPEPPTGLVATTVSPTSINLTWAPSPTPGVTYELERKLGPAGENGFYVKIASLAFGTTDYLDTGLEPTWTCTYRLRVVKGSLFSDYTDEASATTGLPLPPTDLVAVATSPASINLTWTASLTLGVTYELERKIGPADGDGDYRVIAFLSAGATNYTNTGLSEGTTYTYRLRATISIAHSDYVLLFFSDPSAEATATTFSSQPPVAPSSLTATTASSSSINLTWTASPTGGASYVLERKLGDVGSTADYTQVATFAAGVTTHTDTSLTSATTYTYRLRAVKGGLYSEYTADATATTKLTTPGDFAAEATAWNTVSFTWTPVPEPGATYELERRPATSQSEDDFEQLGDGPLPADTAEYTDTGLTAETDYTYRLRAVSGNITSDYTDTETVTTPPQPPPPLEPPSALTATAASSSSITLTWTASPTDGASYVLERKTSAADIEAAYTQVATPAAGVTTYTDTGLTSATTYTYRLRAVKGGLYSEYTADATATTKLTTPGDFAAGATAWNAIDLSWSVVPETGATYELERKPAAGVVPFAKVASPPVNATTHSDTGLTASTTYIYRLRAVLDDNVSNYTDEITVTTPPPPLPPLSVPAWLSVEAVAWDAVSLSWTAASEIGATYEIERKSGEESIFVKIADADTDNTALIDDGLAEKTKYTYRIRSRLGERVSDYGVEIAVTTPARPPEPPGSLVVWATGFNSILLMWEQSPTMDVIYEIERKNPGGGYVKIDELPDDVLYYHDMALYPSTTYFYRVRAAKEDIASDYTNEAGATTHVLPPPPDPPAGLAAIAISWDRIKLFWSVSLESDVSYLIWRKAGDSESDFSLIGTSSLGAGTYTDGGLLPDTTYTYFIQAKRNLQTSAKSEEVSATTLDLQGLPTSGMRLWLNADTLISGPTVYWDDSSGNDKRAYSGFGESSPVVIYDEVFQHNYVHFDSKGKQFLLISDPMDIRSSGQPEAVEGFIVVRAVVDDTGEARNNGLWPFSLYGGISYYPGHDGQIQDFFGSMDLQVCGMPIYDITEWRLYNVSSKNGEWVCHLDGAVQYSSANNIVSVTDGLCIGRSGTHHFDGDVAEVILYDRVLAPEERVKVQNILADKYQLTNVKNPDAPANLTAMPDDEGGITLTWSASLASGGVCELERKTAGANFEKIAELPPNVLSFDDISLSQATAYTYRIRAVKHGKYSDYSNEASAVTRIHRPAGLTATVASHNMINVSWDALDDPGRSLELERKIGNATFTKIATIAPGVTVYVDAGLFPDTLYTYRVRARALGVVSAYSEVASAATAGRGTIPLTGMRLWLNAGTQNPGPLALWRDQSDAGNDAFQDTDSFQPQVIEGDVNGHNVVRFEKQSHLGLPDVMSGATEGEAFAVVKASNKNAEAGFWHFGASVYYGNSYATNRITESFGTRFNYSCGTPVCDIEEWRVYNVSSRQNEWIVRLDGMRQYHSLSNTVEFRTDPTLGRNNLSPTVYRYFQGDIAEVIIFDRVLQESERLVTQNYLGNKYNLGGDIEVSPPSNLKFQAISNTAVKLSWSGGENSWAQYQIERKIPGGEWEHVAVSQSASFRDSELQAGGIYAYRVRVIHPSGFGGWSSELLVVLTTFADGEFPKDGLRLWLRPEYLKAGPLDVWYDNSGRDMDATQQGAGNRPEVVADGSSAWPVVRFDGAKNQYLHLPGNLMNSATAAEVFVVLKATSCPAVGMYRGGLWTISDYYINDTGYPTHNGKIVENFGTGDIMDCGSPVSDITRQHIYNISAGKASTEWVSRIDDIIQAQLVPATDARFSSMPTLGLAKDILGYKYFDGDIAELIIFDRTLTVGERQEVNDYLKLKHGLSENVQIETPGNLTVTSRSVNSVSLSWTASVVGGVIYELERKSLDGEYEKVASMPQGVTHFTDSGLAENSSYAYQLRAVKGNMISGYTNEVFATTLITLRPPVIRLINPPEGKLVAWNESVQFQAVMDDPGTDNVAMVEFYRNGSLFATCTEYPYQVELSQLEPGEWTLLARAVTDNGMEAFSEAVVIIVEGPPAGDAVTFSPSYGASQVRLEPSSGASEALSGVTIFSLPWRELALWQGRVASVSGALMLPDIGMATTMPGGLVQFEGPLYAEIIKSDNPGNTGRLVSVEMVAAAGIAATGNVEGWVQAGDVIAIRPHHTIGRLFGAENALGFASAPAAGEADIISFQNVSDLAHPVMAEAAQSSYYYSSLDSPGWTRAADGVGAQQDVPVYPDRALQITRRSPHELVFARAGLVRDWKSQTVALPRLSTQWIGLGNGLPLLRQALPLDFALENETEPLPPNAAIMIEVPEAQEGEAPYEILTMPSGI
jgi:hypothetical protein